MRAYSDKQFAFIISCWFLLGLLVGYGLCLTITKPAQADTPFDHSQCQYPDRTTNPVNGCDNTDPCDPENAAKGGSGDCSDAVCGQRDYYACMMQLCLNGAGRCEDKDADDLPDPNRHSFDAAGNEYDATGKLVKPAGAASECR